MTHHSWLNIWRCWHQRGSSRDSGQSLQHLCAKGWGDLRSPSLWPSLCPHHWPMSQGVGTLSGVVLRWLRLPGENLVEVAQREQER